MAITLTDFDDIWASTSPLTPYSFTSTNYNEGWNFIGSTPPSRQMWDYLQNRNDEKAKYIVNNYLSLSGGTMTGAINTSESQALKKTDSDNYIQINSGEATADGSNLVMCAKGYSGGLSAGSFQLTARDSNDYKTLYGKPDGTLTWNSQRVHNGNASSVWSSFTPSEAQFGAIFVDVGFAVFCNSWQGANITRSAGALLFTIDSDHLPAYDLRIPFVYNTGNTVGVVKIEASTGKATVETISSTSAQGRLTIGGFMWVKSQSLW